MNGVGSGERRGPNEDLESARNFFNNAERIFDLLGFDDARDKLRLYRSGLAGVYDMSEEEKSRRPAIEDAIDLNRTRFEKKDFPWAYAR